MISFRAPSVAGAVARAHQVEVCGRCRAGLPERRGSRVEDDDEAANWSIVCQALHDEGGRSALEVGVLCGDCSRELRHFLDGVALLWDPDEP